MNPMFIEYPKCLYMKDTTETLVVTDAAEEVAAAAMGWETAEEFTITQLQKYESQNQNQNQSRRRSQSQNRRQSQSHNQIVVNNNDSTRSIN